LIKREPGRIPRHFFKGNTVKRLLLLAALLLPLAACAASPLQQAQEEVAASSSAVTIAATSATAAHQAGLIKPGALETDITLGLHGAQSAMDQANAQLKAGSSGGVSFYVSQVSAFLVKVWTDLNAVGVKQP